MWFRISSFFIFLFKSKNKHSIHSPFVFNIVTKCFNAPTNLEKRKHYKNIRNFFLSNSQEIEVLDFGQGSTYFKSNKRKISSIAKVSGISIKNAHNLIRLVNYFKPQTILEIGTSLGLATAAIHLGNSHSKITTLEGCPKTAAYAKSMFKNFNLETINLIEGNFETTLQKVLTKKYDLIYFDGNHNKEATLSYFKQCLNSFHNDSIFIFDDIYWSKGMKEAWNEIKNNELVTVTIDTFHWGIVFFRKEQKKQHFTIKI